MLLYSSSSAAERHYHSKGSDIGDRMVAGDTVLVQRGTDRFKATYTGSWDKIQDSDLVLAWDGTNNRKVTGATFKTLFVPPPPDPIAEWDWKGTKPDFDDVKSSTLPTTIRLPPSPQVVIS